MFCSLHLIEIKLRLEPTFKKKKKKKNLLAFISGVLLLDFEARDFHNVVYRLVEEFGINDDLSSETKAEVLRTLLLPHRYVDGHTSNFTIGNFKRSLSRSSLRGSMRGFSAVSHFQVTPKSQLKHIFLCSKSFMSGY